MTTKYYATSNLYLPRNQFLAKTFVVPAGMFDEKQIKSLLKRGAIAPVPENIPPATKPDKDKTTNQESIPSHMWAFDIDTIKDVPLEHLNIMIVDHVKKHGLKAMPPFEDREEAVLFMTQHAPAKKKK